MSNRTYEHVWQSENIGYNPEGFIRGMVNGVWVDYDYATTSKSPDEPDCYRQVKNLTYLGYLDEDSPIDQTYNYKLHESSYEYGY